MDNRFNNNDFEQFVKQNANQYRMFPSEKVWAGIHNTLHTRRRWYGIGLALLILTTGTVTWVMSSLSGKNRQIVSTLPKITTQQPVKEKKQSPEVVVIVPAKAANDRSSFIATADNLQKNLFINTGTTEPEAGNIIISDAPAIAYNDPAPVTKVEISHQPESIVKTSTSSRPVFINNPVNKPAAPVRTNDYAFSVITNTENTETAATISEEKSITKNDIYPFSIESVINSYKHIKKRKKIAFQVYITPTISYRELKENKSFINSARNATNGTTNVSYSTDINSVVTHKPDIGLQLGVSTGYPLSKNLKLTGGLQFNISKYDIRAYTHPSEVATITLSNTAGGTNTVSTLTNYRNAGGYKANWLHNLYFSVSAPIGLELKLMGTRKTYLGIGGTVQPSYILSNRAYLISTDYKNYAEVPSLIRKWNINTAFEMFAGYSTGKLKWRVGPQVRYQTMSSFQKKYPVQEHLFDFGLKLGILFNK
jgi:hypothetical protein